MSEKYHINLSVDINMFPLGTFLSLQAVSKKTEGSLQEIILQMTTILMDLLVFKTFPLDT